MNLVHLAREVLEDQTNLRSALSRIKRPTDFQPDWEETTARAIELLLEEAELCSEAARVEDMGRLAEEAAGLLGAEEGALVALRVARLLLTREAPRLALGFLERATAMRGSKTARLEAECWLIRCLAELGESHRVAELLPRALELARAIGVVRNEVILLVIAGREAVGRFLERLDGQLERRHVGAVAVEVAPDAVGPAHPVDRDEVDAVVGDELHRGEHEVDVLARRVPGEREPHPARLHAGEAAPGERAAARSVEAGAVAWVTSSSPARRTDAIGSSSSTTARASTSAPAAYRRRRGAVRAAKPGA